MTALTFKEWLWETRGLVAEGICPPYAGCYECDKYRTEYRQTLLGPGYIPVTIGGPYAVAYATQFPGSADPGETETENNEKSNMILKITVVKLPTQSESLEGKSEQVLFETGAIAAVNERGACLIAGAENAAKLKGVESSRVQVLIATAGA